MKKVLVPVDGSASAEHAVQYVVALVRGGMKLDVELLNVQSPLDSAYLQRFVTHDALEGWYREEGDAAIQPASVILTKADVKHKRTVEIGPVAETIGRYAQEGGFDTIVMGTRGMGSFGNLVLGSVATRVIHTAEIPVTLVK